MIPGGRGAVPQISEPINDGKLMAVPGSPTPVSAWGRDQGPVSSDMVFGRLQMVLKRSPQQEAALQGLLDAQQDIDSPLYHHWLTPEEFGSQFGPAQEDIDKVTGWLRSKGMEVTRVSKGRSSIEFSATHRQIQNAFHTQLHWYDTKAGREYSNVSSPKIPAALGPAVAGISSLNSMTSRPLSHVARQVSTRRAAPGGVSSYTSGATNALAPGDYWTIYNATPAETAGITGKGVTIGIAGRSHIADSDVASFRSTYLGDHYSGTFQQIVNGPDPGKPQADEIENTLDVEWASALAPDAKVVLVSSMNNGADGVYLAAEYLIDNNLADIVSVSYGACESFQGTWTIAYGALWEQAAAQGITVAVATGDNGTAGCDNDAFAAAQFGMQVNGLASSPYNVAVGGTQFVDQGDSWGSSTRLTPLPGTSAQGYIPEAIWNESQAYSTLYAGSGGPSNCYFNLLSDAYDTAACTGGWPKPVWQAGVTGIPEDGVRDLPDVSFTSALHDGYLVTLGGNMWVVGGTSAATPSFAGVMALVNQKAGGRQGMANPLLYALAGQEFGAPGAENQASLQSCNASLQQNRDNACVFYDVTSGSNAVPCIGGTQSCSATNPDETGLLAGYGAGAGYDLGSGLGSINISNLVNAWPEAAKGNSPSTTTLQISPAWGIVHGSPVSVSITVEPATGSGTPTGSVRVVANGGVVATEPLSHGSWSGQIATLPGGDVEVTAQYSGDASYASSTSAPVRVNVSPEPSITTVSVKASDVQLGSPLPIAAIPYGSNVILNATVRGQSGSSAREGLWAYMFFSMGGDSYGALVDTSGNSAYPITTLSPGAYSVTATYQGDLNFASSTSSSAAQFTVVPASTAVSLTASTPGVETTPVTAVVAARTFGVAPSGGVSFFVNGTPAGTAAVIRDPWVLQSWVTATFNVPTILLHSGSNAITAQYAGDANYAPSPVSPPLSLTPNDLTVTAPAPPPAPSMATEVKAGTRIRISAIILENFQNLHVEWAPGINPDSGWTSGGVTLSGDLAAPVLNVPIATWDTTSIATAGFYSVRVTVTAANVTSTASTYVYLEPDLLSSNWPMLLASEVDFNGSIVTPAPVPAADSSGNTSLLLGTFGWPGGQIFKTSMDGSAQNSYPVSMGSWYQAAAANLHFLAGDDLIYPDNNAVVVMRSDGTKETLALPSSMSGQTFYFRNTQVVVDDVDGDSLPEVVAVGIGPGPTPWTTSAYLFAWRNNGQQLNGNFPIVIPDLDPYLGFSPVRVLVGDVDGDGSKELVVLEGTTGTSFTPRLFAADGTPKPWNTPATQRPLIYQMALADLDHNGKLETIFESLPADGMAGSLNVLNPDGSERQGWPLTLPYYGPGDSIAIGDLNRDGHEEIVLSTGGALSVYSSDGTPFWPNWTNPYGGFGPAVIADVNGDGFPEIVAPLTYLSQNPAFAPHYVTELEVLDRSGATIRSWRLSGANGQEPLWANAMAGDFLGDGKSEIASGYSLVGSGMQVDQKGIQVGSTQMGVSILSTGWSYNAAASDWPMLHRNSQQQAVLRRVSPARIDLSSSANPSTAVSPPSFTLSVSPAPGSSGAPTGKVNLIDGEQNIGSCVLSSGSCVIMRALAIGTHHLIAGYVGDQEFDLSYSPSLTQVVTVVPTNIALAISPNSTSLQAGSTYTLTATVTASSGTAVPSGSVVFTIGAATQTVALNASGVATYTGSAPTTSGPLSLSAVYEGSTEFSASTSNTLNETIVTPPAETPTFNVPPATYITTQTVAISDATPGVTIYYTTNGSTPTGSSSVYGGPITVSSTETIEAMASGNGYSASAVASATYTITPPAATPTFSVKPGTYTTTLTVAISDATPGVTIYYTKDGSTPTTSSFVYSGPITVSSTESIEAMASGNGHSASAVASATYTITLPPTLTFNVAGLSFGSEPLNTTSPAQTAILANPNPIAITITGPFASGDFTANSNCPVIAAGGTCSMNVTFTPSAAGTRTGTLTVSGSGVSPLSIPLNGTGTTSGIQVTPAAINFGSQATGATSFGQTITIQNTGDAALTISNIATTGDFASSGSCSTVPAGTGCSLTVMFAPTAVGTRTGSFTLTDNAGGDDTSQIVTLSGIGTGAGAGLSPGLLTFPPTLVGATSFQINATLTNSGTADLAGIAVSVQGDFIQTNTCSSTLGAGETCTIGVKYVPSITGAESGNITVTDSLGSQSLSLKGTGIAPGVSLSTSELQFGGQLVTTTSQAQTVILTNTGSAPLAIDSVHSSLNFTHTTNCAGTIPAGSSCSINIFFAPTTTGSLIGTITVTDSAGTQTIHLQGLGHSAGLTVKPSFAIFGAQPVNSTSQAQTLTAKNTGTTPMTLRPIAVTGNFTESDNCPTALQVGASCTISVCFSPSATGSLSGSVNISDTTGAAATMATISGQGTLPGVSASPATEFFGSVPVGTNSQAQTITVTNTGTAPLQIGSVTGNGDFGETDTCANQAIAVGSYCLINVTMTPTTTAMRTGSIEIINSADGSHNVALSGMGQATGVSVSPTSLAFGSAPISSAKGTSLNVTVTNTGTLPLAFNGATAQGDYAESDSCDSSIAVGASCILHITFVPTGLGHRTGTLTITDNAGGGVQLVALEGDGSPAGLTLTPPVLTFATPERGVTSQPQTVVLSNQTGTSLNNVVIAASGEFAESDNCGTTLANGANCTVSITVTPAMSGAITGTVTISSGGQIAISSGAVRTHRPVRAEAATMSSSTVAVVALSTAAIAAAPTFSVPAGTYTSAQTVTIFDSTPGATIYYTTDGTTPTTSSRIYNGPITVSSVETIEAFAAASGYVQSNVAIAAYTINLPAPVVTVTPSSSSITTAQSLPVTVGVGGTPRPTGTVTLTSSTYSSGPTLLSSDGAIITIPAGSLPPGSKTLIATYTPDIASSSNYTNATGTASVTVTVPLSFTLSASPASVSVAQNGSGTSTISVTEVGGFSGTVTLAATGLPSGVTASFAAGTAAGTQVLTLAATKSAAVAGPVPVTIDGTSGNLTASTTIALTITAEAAFAGSGSDAHITIAAGATTGNTSTISVKGTNGFSGTVNLACSISPTAASHPPTCTLSPSSLILSGNTEQTSIVTVNTTGATSAVKRGERLFWPTGGTALSVLLFFTVRRRRNWLAMLGLLVLALSSGLSACGGGSMSGGGSTGVGNPGTTPGTYTVTITGTSGTISATVGTVRLTVE